jgi:hypothetical protein
VDVGGLAGGEKYVVGKVNNIIYYNGSLGSVIRFPLSIVLNFQCQN